MSYNIGKSFINAENKIITIPLAIFSILIAFYLLVNGGAIFGNSFSSGDASQSIVEIYLLLDAGVLFLVPFQTSPMYRVTASDLIFFVPAFLFTGLAIGNFYVPVIPNNTANYEILMIIFQIFVVTFSETWIFLGAIQTYLMDRHIKSAFLIQAVLFGFFHYSAYGGSLTAMFQAIGFGLIVGIIYLAFYQMKKPDWGLAISWGIHAGWNIALLTTIFAVSTL